MQYITGDAGRDGAQSRIRCGEILACFLPGDWYLFLYFHKLGMSVCQLPQYQGQVYRRPIVTGGLPSTARRQAW